MTPTSGGQYHCAAMLSPPRPRSVVTWMGSQALSVRWIADRLRDTEHRAPDASRIPRKHARLAGHVDALGCRAQSDGINSSFDKLFARFEGFASIIHILGVMLPLVLPNDHASTEKVFETFSTLVAGPQGLSFCLGIVGLFSRFSEATALFT